MNISTADITSTGIRKLAELNNVETVECLGRFEHPDHPGSNDWSITVYRVAGGLVADTNGDPVIEDASPSGFAELLAIYGVEL